MSGRVTIKSIAKDLGISHMTVSRALSNHPNVHEKTRKAVQDRARELGYVKNAAAKAMRGEQTQIVGLLLPNIVNEFYARFANAMALACEAQALHLIIHLTNDDLTSEEHALERLHEVQAKAVIMVPAPGVSATETPHLEAMKVVQLIRQRPMDFETSSVLVDDSQALKDAVVHLAQRGHKKIGYIGGGSDLSSGRERLAAYQSGLAASELVEDSEVVSTGPPSFSMGRENARRLIDGQRATAIVCGGFEISNGVLSTLIERGTLRRGDIAFVGYGDPSFYSWIDDGISTIRIPVEQLAKKAVELVQAPASLPHDSEEAKLRAELIVRDGSFAQ